MENYQSDICIEHNLKINFIIQIKFIKIGTLLFLGHQFVKQINLYTAANNFMNTICYQIEINTYVWLSAYLVNVTIQNL